MRSEMKQLINYQYQVYSSAQGLIPLADAKAGAIIGANLALIATFINAPFFNDKFVKIVKMVVPPQHIMLTFTAFVIFSIISIICAVLVLYPRPSLHMSKLHPPRLTFYQHVFNHNNAERYLNRVSELSEDSILQEMCVQNFEISTILDAKYRMSKISLAAFLMNMLAWSALLFTIFNYQM